MSCRNVMSQSNGWLLVYIDAVELLLDGIDNRTDKASDENQPKKQRDTYQIKTSNHGQYRSKEPLRGMWMADLIQAFVMTGALKGDISDSDPIKNLDTIESHRGVQGQSNDYSAPKELSMRACGCASIKKECMMNNKCMC